MNWLDLINVIANILIGITAIASLGFSIKALKKSEWDSAMGTAPSLVLRPTNVWVGTRDKKEYRGYGVVESGRIIKSEPAPVEIVFAIEFECFNAGRGVAFNISQPESVSMIIEEFYKTPLHQTLKDEPFTIRLIIKKRFKEWLAVADKKIPVCLLIKYTNDQNTVYCKSTWRANIKPFKIENGDLKIRKIKVLNRKSKIEYSDRNEK